MDPGTGSRHLVPKGSFAGIRLPADSPNTGLRAGIGVSGLTSVQDHQRWPSAHGAAGAPFRWWCHHRPVEGST